MASIRNTTALWGEIFQLALQALRANKMRSTLTMLGVVIGTASVVFVVTIALTGQRYILAQIENVGANLVYARVLQSGDTTPPLADNLTEADREAVQTGLPGIVVGTAGSNWLSATMDVNGQERLINLVGVTDGFRQIRNLQVSAGRYFDPDDLETGSKVCLLTQALAQRIAPVGDPVGQDIQVGELHFTVIGVLRESTDVLGESEISRESVVIPFSLMRSYTGGSYFRTLYARADNPDDVPAVTRDVAEILQSRHRPGARYRVQNLSSILETARNVGMGLTVVLVLVALIALAISGIGIMNIMLVTVTERTREIGIRKAIGATRDAIRYQFLMEAVVISGLGALAGILIAVSIPPLLNFLINFIPDAGGVSVQVSWVSVALAFIVSCSTGLLFGYLPANRAAGLEPARSLHYE
ncbi:MAG TPA: ABC transporter permease [Candidatus Baltobacteraceae bacterium]|nr:ABC transporter permease [Candidatus Baltobacteraceae bacterium]